MYDASRILSAFNGLRLKQTGPQRWRAQCPLHGKHCPNLNIAIWRRDDNQGWLLACWAGCDKREVLAAVGLTMKDLFDNEMSKDQPKRKIVATYDYRDEAGTLLYQVVRYDPKGFAQRCPAEGPHNKDGWRWMLAPDVRRVLYRTPELLAKPEHPVVIVEGEKDADRLFAGGLLATCNVGGTGMGWRPEYSQQLKHRRIVVIPDNDPPGWRHAWSVAGSLLWHGAGSVRIVPTDGASDVSHWLDQTGNSIDALKGIIRAASEWRAA